MEFADHPGQGVTGFRVEVVAGSIQISWHRGNEVVAELLAIRGHQF